MRYLFNLNRLKIQSEGKPLTSIYFHFFMALLVCYLISFITTPYWTQNAAFLHTTVEISCIFIALSAFFVIWHSYEQNSSVNLLIGFGFLSVAIFDILHALFYPLLDIIHNESDDLFLWFWFIGRILEGLVLLCITLNINQITRNKWSLLLITLLITLSISILINYNADQLPVLNLEGQGSTSMKIGIELLIIALYLLCLVKLHNKLNDFELITYRYIFIALLLAIPAELCFTLFKTPAGFFSLLGHALKIAYYYYIFRGIFVSAVTYPYKKLELASIHITEVLNNVPVGIAAFDYDGKLVYANRRAEELLGYGLERLIGLPVNKILHEVNADRQNSPSSAGTGLNWVGLNSVFKVIKNSSGQKFKVKVDCRSFNEQGFMLMFDEAKKEQALENMQLQTQTILNAIKDMALITNKYGKIIQCNNAMAKALGLQLKNIIGMDLSEFKKITKFVKKEYSVGYSKPTEQGASLGEASFVGKNGIKVDVIYQFGPIYNVEGEIIGHIGLGSDITLMKNNQRTIQQQEKLAMLGEMASGIVHEIKNPLTTIKGFSQVLAAKEQDSILKNYAQLINNEADAVNQVVSDFLTFAKPSRPVLKELTVNSIFDSMQSMLESQLFLKKIDFKIAHESNEYKATADISQLKQVVVNLVKNSIDAVEEVKNPRIRIFTGYDRNSQMLFIKVTDNGKGITEEELAVLGTPFYTTKDTGTGLGLSICYQLIKENRGKIHVDSEPGRGTTFTVFLHAQKAENQIA